jgi:predicted NBD/HSP70 family sugar kinase
MAALGEQQTGVAKDVPCFAFIYLGAGIGGAIVVDGQLVRGSGGLAGEIGYLPSRADTSGRRHGLARAIAAFGLGPRRQDAWYADTVTEARAVLTAAEMGESRAFAAVEKAGRALGEAAMAITAVIDPDVLVLGGPVGIHPLLLAQVQDTLDELAAAPTKVVGSALGETAPLQGALVLARSHARENL